MGGTDEPSGVRLAEVLVALSIATDVGLGQPLEHMLRSARIALRLGDRLRLTDDERQTLYDVALLTYVGCPVHGDEAAAWFGDDIAFRAGVSGVDLAGFPALRYMVRHAGAGGSPLHRGRMAASIVATGGRAIVEQMSDHCAAAGQLAGRLELGDDARTGIEQTYARWDGNGVPGGIGGDDLSLAARISHLAETVEIFHRTGGTEAAVAVAEARRATHFDPAVVDVLAADPEPLFADLGEATLDAVLDAEPGSRGVLSPEELDSALAAIADFCDLRCPFFAGHARGTAVLAEAAGRQLSLPDETVELLRRAALVHDLGRAGVPGTIWDKPAALTEAEHERMRLHVYLVERMFRRPEPLERIGALASTHHERMDGSGYHRGLAGALVAVPARVLAAADALHAMGQPRPHRPALTPDAAAGELRAEADAGRLDPVAVDAVLAAAGQRPSSARGGGPAGLTAREADVLALIAQGLTNKAVAHRLGIKPKTVGNHVERIYAKVGVSSRAAAALYAMQHGLVPSAAALA